MEITRTCPFCGVVHTLDIDVEPEQMEMWDNGMLIQEAMPHLTPDEREHIMSGICTTCWPSDEGISNYADGSQEQYDSWDEEEPVDRADQALLGG